VCIHQFHAQAYFLSENNSWDEVKSGELLDFSLLEDKEATLFRLVGWTQTEEVAINVNLCRKSEFKIDHARFSYVSVPGDTSMGQLLGMSFTSDEDNKKTMMVIASAISKMKEKRRFEDEREQTTQSYDVEEEGGDMGPIPSSDDDEEKEEQDLFDEDEMPSSEYPDTPPPSDLRPLTKFLEAMKLENEVDAMADHGLDTIGRIMSATKDDFKDVPVKSVTVKILLGAVEILKPYVQELTKEGADLNNVLLDDDSILATLHDLANKMRDEHGRSSPRRPPRPASRPDMLESLRSNSKRRSRKSSGHKRASITSSTVLNAAQRSAKNRMRRSFKGSNVDVKKKVLSGRARTDSHSPYIRASTVRTYLPIFENFSPFSLFYLFLQGKHTHTYITYTCRYAPRHPDIRIVMVFLVFTICNVRFMSSSTRKRHVTITFLREWNCILIVSLVFRLSSVLPFMSRVTTQRFQLFL